MIEAEYHFNLPVPRNVAFKYLCNPANDRKWQSACMEARLLDAEPRVGSCYQVTFDFIGRRMQFEGEITRLEFPMDCAFRVLNGPVFYQSSYALSPHGAGTHVHWRFDVDLGRFLGMLPGALLRKLLVRQAEKDSVTLARRLLAQQAMAHRA